MSSSPRKLGDVPMPIAIGVIVAVTLFFVWGILDGAERPPPSTMQPPKTDECKKSVECWARRHISEADACTKAIERLTSYKFEWTHAFLESRFTAYRWHNTPALTLTYLGDSLLVQNEHGAFTRTSYECDYDPLGRAVLGARIRPGRLSD